MVCAFLASLLSGLADPSPDCAFLALAGVLSRVPRACTFGGSLKSTMMSSPLLVPGMLERAGKLFPRVEIVAYLPDGSRHSYTISDSTDARGIWQLRSVARESAEVTGLALYLEWA